MESTGILYLNSSLPVCIVDFDFLRLPKNVIAAIEEKDDLTNKLIRVTKGQSKINLLIVDLTQENIKQWIQY